MSMILLSATRENSVTTGTDNPIDDAFIKAINELPHSVDKITNLLISFHFGNLQPYMADRSKIPFFLSDANPDMDVK